MASSAALTSKSGASSKPNAALCRSRGAPVHASVSPASPVASMSSAASTSRAGASSTYALWLSRSALVHASASSPSPAVGSPPSPAAGVEARRARASRAARARGGSGRAAGGGCGSEARSCAEDRRSAGAHAGVAWSRMQARPVPRPCLRWERQTFFGGWGRKMTSTFSSCPPQCCAAWAQGRWPGGRRTCLRAPRRGRGKHRAAPPEAEGRRAARPVWRGRHARRRCARRRRWCTRRWCLPRRRRQMRRRPRQKAGPPALQRPSARRRRRVSRSHALSSAAALPPCSVSRLEPQAPDA